MRSIVEMRENTILSLEGVLTLAPGNMVVRIPVHSSFLEVPDLRDSLLSVAHLFVEEARFFRMRVNIRLSVYNVVDLTASIVDAFAKV